jgi:hypothetical protein
MLRNWNDHLVPAPARTRRRAAERPSRRRGRLAHARSPWHTSRVRLSRPRVLLRAALLALGGGFMLWRAWQARSAADGLPAAESLLLRRVALVELLVGLLALAAAGMALLALRRRPHRQTLHLKDLDRG